MINWFSKFFKKKGGGTKAKEERTAPPKAPSECGIEDFKKLFENDDTFVAREFLCGGRKCCIAFINGMVEAELISKHITEPLMRSSLPANGDILRYLMDSVITADEIKRHADIHAAAPEVITGDTAIFIEGAKEILTVNSKKWNVRAITEPETEKATKGPREGFNESLIVNMGLLRRKLVTPDLKIKFRTIGRRSNTKAAVFYLQSIANREVIDELNRRLDAIDIDAVLSVNYIDEMIRDSPVSPFMTTSTTERPDVVAAKLLEGRVGLMVEGCPCGLTVPFVFVEYFQAAEDYYGNFWMASISRAARIIGFILTITVPAVYLAMVTMHQEMVPTDLLLAITASRQQVPLPAVLELILMLILIEILREAGARTPTFLGTSLSIVGGLVIGQAAVAAKLISAPIIIIVATTMITSMLLPKIEGAAFLLRIGFVLVTSVLGFYGLMIGMTAMFIHLLGIRSFGVPYMSNILPMTMQDFKDVAIRMPWYYMVLRPRHISAKDSVRQSGRKV